MRLASLRSFASATSAARFVTLPLFFGLVPCLLQSGCGGSGSGSAGGTTTLAIAWTDAALDEIASFEVALESIRLTRRGGGVVSVLREPVSVDLVTLQELSQLVDLVDVPAGRYVAAELEFDFAGARCVLVGETTPAALLDPEGDPLDGTVVLPLSLAGAPIDAVGGRRAVLELDFDLDASLSVDALANAVTVQPTIVVRFDPNEPRELVAPGTLVAVDPVANTAVIDVKTLAGTPVTTATLQFDVATLFQIDGAAALGAAGVAALAAQPAGTWVQAYGALDPTAPLLDVSYLEAGRGTWNGGDDVVEGHVVGRSGGAGSDATLLVLGHSQDAGHSLVQFNTLFTVAVGHATTAVVRRAELAAYDSDDLNVGQLVRCYGSLAGTALDATSGVVRAQPTRLLGLANGAPTGDTLALELSRIGLCDAAAFAWGDAGTTPPDPDDLQLDVGTLADPLAIDFGTAVEARGYFAAVDAAGPDFVADALVNRDGRSLLLVIDRIGGFTVTPSATSDAVALSISGSAGPLEVALLDRGFVGLEPLPTSLIPTLVPGDPATVYLLRDRSSGQLAVHATFASWSNGVADALRNGQSLLEVSGVGAWDAAAGTLAAKFACATVR